MHGLLNDWNHFLVSSGTTFGLMVVLTGISFLLIGWRIGRIAITIIYTMAGIALGVAWSGEMVSIYVGGALGGIICGGLSRIFHRYASPILAGVAGSITLWAILGDTTMPTPAVYIMLVLAFLGVGAPAMSNKKATTIVLTSFVGAALLASGVTALATASRSMAPQFRALAAYGVFYPSLLIIPAISGIFLQMSALQSKDGGEVSP